MQKTTDTKQGFSTPAPRKAHQPAACATCQRIQKLDARAGWCPARSQYRALDLMRDCADHRDAYTTSTP